MGNTPVISLEDTTPAVSQAEHAYRSLEAMLVTLKLPPNALLSEEELSRKLGIGRTPVREAVKRLAMEGLISIKPRKGLIVTPIDEQHHLLLLEVRRELERLIARRAAIHRTEKHRETFLELAKRMQEAGERRDYDVYLDADEEFNNLILEAAVSPPLKRIMASIHPAMRRFWYSHHRYLKDRTPLGGAQHANVMYAVAEGDPERAAKASDELMDYVEGVARSVVPLDFESSPSALNDP